MSGFVRYVDELDFVALGKDYRLLAETAPRRHHATPPKRYLVDHKSVAGTTGSNRTEEHLAAALFWARRLQTHTGPLTIIDFQTPLKAQQSDQGVGKLDLLGIKTGLVAIELKVLRPGRTADTPIDAALELLCYGAIIEGNWGDLTSEIAGAGHLRLTPETELLVLGTADYWSYWDTKAAAVGWRDALQKWSEGVSENIRCRATFGVLTGVAEAYAVEPII